MSVPEEAAPREASPQALESSLKAPVRPRRPTPLDDPALFINREISLLEFHRRVFEQSRDARTPLLERLRFLCISSSNLDEFFEIRVAGLIQQVEYGSQQLGPDRLSPAETLERISDLAHELVRAQYDVLNEELIPALERERIRFVRRRYWNRRQAAWIKTYFEEQILPILSPIRLDPAHPFPRVLNKRLHFIVRLDGEDAFGHGGGMAVVPVPRPLPRLIRLPEEVSREGHEIIFLSSVMHAHMAELFPGMEVRDCFQFRVTRNSDLFVDAEEVDDLLGALQGELHSRRYGDEVRIEVDETCPEEVVAFLRSRFGLTSAQVYRVDGPVNLHRLAALPELVDRADLKYPPFIPSTPPALAPETDFFAAIRGGDILLHHPFESFTPVIELVRQAAADPDVLAIKQTLYRTGPDSALVDALVLAARGGKEVTVVVELRARFDEEANIALASRLQEAGANVVYGVVGYKTHAKMLLIVRREDGKPRRYVHLGTGNYHEQTTRLYTDYGLLTADESVGEDVHRVFLQLTSLGRASRLRRLLQSPFTLHRGMLTHIEREAANAQAGRPARIIAKMNGLIEPAVIKALYEASGAGVSIDLIVRGMCALKPGVAGVSENIRVRSVIGRFLEHTRVFYFENGGEPVVYCASADWMQRNLFQRVETCFPILDPALRERIRKELDLYLEDDAQAWIMKPDGSFERAVREAGGDNGKVAQESLLALLAARASPAKPAKMPLPKAIKAARRGADRKGKGA